MFRKIGVVFASFVVVMLAGTAKAQDPYQWLEAPQDPKALEWAQQQTQTAKAEISRMPRYAEVRAELQTLLAASDPPPQFALMGAVALRFQRTADNPHGVLSVGRRGTDGVPGNWREVLNVEKLRTEQGKSYELRFGGDAPNCLPPAYTRCLLALSPSGGDEVEFREFDLVIGKFVAGGFATPASRSSAAWLDQDRLLIGHSVGNVPKLATGAPATISIWTRNTPLSAGKIIFQADPNDAILSVSAAGEGPTRVGIIRRVKNFSAIEHLIVRSGGRVEATNLPTQIKVSMVLVGGTHLFALLDKPATVAGKVWPADSVVAYDTRANVPAQRRLSLVYAPAAGEFLSDRYHGVAAGRTTVRMVLDRRGAKRVITATRGKDGWSIDSGATKPVGVSAKLVASDPASDAVIVQSEGYLTPSRLDLIGTGVKPVTLFAEPPAFDANNFTVELKTARSKDGVEIDYYLLRPKTLTKRGATPTLMTGYGAFGATVPPEYLGNSVGGKSFVLWLKRGGAFVMPMIRGGGERGSAWHDAAVREKRQISYDDFATVTETLVSDGLTSPKHIGVFGSSNGGLLAAVMGTQRPDLYGAIVSDVPLTDLLRMPYMGMGAAWTNEYGSPADPKMKAVISRYSPYQNVKAGNEYPPFMITVATSDNRVGPGHARKLAAKLKQSGATVFFLEDQEGGHGVSDALYRPDLMAARMTFLLDALQ